MEASSSRGKKKEEWHHEPLSVKSNSSALLKERDEREKVNQTLERFRNLFAELLSDYEANGYKNATNKALLKAAMQMKDKWMNREKRLGHVPGIEVGDRFQYRTELNVIGLHRQFSSGIDYMWRDNCTLATSIVVTDRYANDRESSGALVYSGHGGNPNTRTNGVPHDQKLEGGNLALKHSMDAKTPVRVILKVSAKLGNTINDSFMYDGLYIVNKMSQERGEFGKLVFKFVLNRILEQPSSCVSPKDEVYANNSRLFPKFSFGKRQRSKGIAAKKDVVILNDISQGQEKFPIRVVASAHVHQMPQTFDYIVNNIHVDGLKLKKVLGCDCVDGCVDYMKCACIAKNGGNLPYDSNRRLVSGLESCLIYECGPCCKCSLSCINRVGQHGVQFQLEIFETELKGWGVRTRSFIPSGSFVCEYIGEVCHNREARSRQNVNNYIVNMGVGKSFIDATRKGNIGRFINHSCSPNLHVKDVLYDHNDKNLPHKMLFAARDIPAGRELSYDYNCCKARAISIVSNVCHCGSPTCIQQIYI